MKIIVHGSGLGIGFSGLIDLVVFRDSIKKHNVLMEEADISKKNLIDI